MRAGPLYLNIDNAPKANRAVASVLLLYFHLLREGGFSNDQTVYVNSDDFDPFAYLLVEVSADINLEVDQSLLREGAVIHMLCDLWDTVGEFDSDYLRQPSVKRILGALEQAQGGAIPESMKITSMLRAGESNLDYPELAQALSEIYQRYVSGRFQSLIAQSDQRSSLIVASPTVPPTTQLNLTKPTPNDRAAALRSRWFLGRRR